MYSPKIAEDLIPVLYRVGKKEGKPMTHVVDSLLRETLLERYSAEFVEPKVVDERRKKYQD